MTIRDIAVAFGFNVDKSSQKGAEDAIKGLKSMATKLLGTIAIGFSLTKMNALAEEFNGINDQIKHATNELGDQEEIQQKILKSANETKTSYGEAAKAITNFVQNSNGLFESVDDAVEFNDATTKLFKTAGKGTAEIAGLQEAINKSFAKGAVDTETLNQLIEKSPEAVKLLNRQLGTTSEELLQMATDGKMSLTNLRDAFLNNTDEINKNFDNLDYSISDALLNMRNQWGLFCNDLWVKSGITNDVGKLMVRAFTGFMNILKKLQPYIERCIRALISGVKKAFDLIQRVGSFLGRLINKMGGIEQVMKLIAIVAGAIWLALNAQKILGFLKSMGKLLTGINLKILAIVAVIVILALIIEDFLAFMRGDDSVIGSLFEKAGIDSEKARETILKAWNKVKTFLIQAWNFIKSVGMGIFNGLKQFWAENGETIKTTLMAIWNTIKVLLTALWKGIKVIAVSVFNGLKAFWDTWGGVITSSFKIIWNTLIALIQPFMSFIRGLMDFISGVFSGDWDKAWNGIKTMFSSIWNAIVIILTGVWDLIKNIFTSALKIIDEKVSSIFQNMKDGIKEKIDAIASAIKTGINAAVEFIKALPKQALEWGKDLILGFVKGITDNISKIADAAKGVGEKIKSFLHFSVPDEGPLTEYESWMPDFMSGLAAGIKGNKGIVLGQIKDLVSGMSLLTQTATAKAATAMNSVQNVSRSVVQNVDISNSYHGSDREAQANVSKAMNRSAADATTYMARGLAYAR